MKSIKGFQILALMLVMAMAGRPAERGNVRGIVHDQQHRPLAAALVTARVSGGTTGQTTRTNENGEFVFSDLDAGNYEIRVSAAGFEDLVQTVSASAEKAPVLHFQLVLSAVSEKVEVSGERNLLTSESSTTQTEIARREIQEAPGADLTNSMAMITDFVPGATMVHDMLHVRGGHQVNWFLDGIPVVNTNIAANVAPLINPKSVEELEAQRGGYSSEYGDRTYGFFNVVTPSGFDRNNDVEFVASYGNFHTTDDQISFGGHTERLAYFASLDGNRSDLGLMNPTASVIHDASGGLGGFVSVLYNPGPKDQLRWIGSLRGDHYQIPNTPEQQFGGTRDGQDERDYLAGFQWTHTVSDGVLFYLSPYLHFNSANLMGGPGDIPYVLQDNTRSIYAGLRAVAQRQKGRHNARAGLDVWAQHDNAFLGLTANPPGEAARQTERNWANSDSVFVEDQVKAATWLTIDAGLRLTHYGGLVNENAADPRLGVAIRVPRLGWVVRGSYSYYYQPPPLNSLSGPFLGFALSQGFGFVPLSGERDIQSDVGLTIPVRGWFLDIDHFHTSARNFLDHDAIGNSGIFVPLSDLGARISGTEIAVRSRELFHTAQLRIAYSNQRAEGTGPITGGLLEYAPSSYFLLDHDQRNTLSSVMSLRLPRQAWMTAAMNFGSGFLNGDGPAHLPPHTTVDVSIGKRFGERWSVAANAVNLGNTRYLIDNSNTFGGTHWVNPRQIYGEFRYRFHF